MDDPSSNPWQGMANETYTILFVYVVGVTAQMVERRTASLFLQVKIEEQVEVKEEA